MRVRKVRCRSCAAWGFFAVSEQGNRMFVHAEPVEPGVTLDRFGRPIPKANVALEDLGAVDGFGNPVPTAIVGTEPRLFGNPPRFVDHHVICPDADNWRKEA